MGEVVGDDCEAEAVPIEETSEKIAAASSRNRRLIWAKKGVGLVVVLLVVSNSIAQSEYAQYNYGSTHLNFKSYYLLSWFTNACLLFCLPLWVAVEAPLYLLSKRLLPRAFSSCFSTASTAAAAVEQSSILLQPSMASHGGENKKEEEAESGPFSATASPSPSSASTSTSYLFYVRHQLAKNPKISAKRYVWSGLLLAAFSTASAYLWYLSLDMIPVTVNSTLYRTGLIFTFIFSVLFLQERVFLLKLLALVLCVGGVVMVGLGNYYYPSTKHDKEDDLFDNKTKGLLGCLVVVASAFLYSCYEVGYRRWIGEANMHGVLLINTIMGVMALTVLWVPIPLLFGFGAEPTPNFADGEVWEFLWVNSIFAVSFYFLYTFGLSLTSPLFIDLTSTIGVPLSGLADFIVYKKTFSALTLVGMATVCIGVFLYHLNDVRITLRERSFWPRRSTPAASINSSDPHDQRRSIQKKDYSLLP
ncbi:hypothetical protein QOT17_014057 [Balamuthia mandrillaris]